MGALMDSLVRRTPGQKPRDHFLTVRVSEDVAKLIDAHAAREDRSRSDMLRVLLREGLDARSKK